MPPRAEGGICLELPRVAYKHLCLALAGLCAQAATGPERPSADQSGGLERVLSGGAVQGSPDPFLKDLTLSSYLTVSPPR